MKTLWRELLLWTWCLPQTLLSMTIFILFMAGDNVASLRIRKNILLVRVETLPGLSGMSIGKCIFYKRQSDTKAFINHEYGHTLQSYYLGPFYIFIVGVPSFIVAMTYHFNERFTIEHARSHFPEKWADDLGEKYPLV